ncbi:MAG: trehalase family glycosidase [Bacteroidota bacterium]|nr:trehalase family glycosidase [Bacteroidota bacterium]
MKRNIFITIMTCCLSQLGFSQSSGLIYRSDRYSVYNNRVEQGKFKAVALSGTKMTSNYQSPEAEKYSPTIRFKFSINLRDNEMLSGKDHFVTLQPQDGKFTTNVVFGKQKVDTLAGANNTNLQPNTQWTVRLDMRDIFKSFKEKGYYTLFNGEKLYQADFKGIYIAGGIRPLSWDFNNLGNRPEYQLKDPDGDGIYETTLTMNAKGDEKKTEAQWELTRDISLFPQYKSDFPLSDAIYNMALEEMMKAVEPDSTFRTGKEWGGVWTRDISYSIILAMANLQPKVARYSLMRKVKNGRIIQDTGTGGAYPVSTDRMIWATAAWELYKTTGDRDWLKQAYEIIRNSVNDDINNAYDRATGLVHGESSFLDWREQTYPKWMQPVDIYESENLGTNAVHYHANVILSQMATLLNDSRSAGFYKQQAEKIKAGINKYLWMNEKGYYGQYLYGRNYKSLSPRAEALGEALCVLFNVANDQQKKSVIENVPVTDFGITCIYPQIPGIPPYHNNAIWPFVQSYWALASAKAGNEKSVLASIAAIYRPAAMFLTNKENLVADNGDFAGTQINSSNMLWSISGSLSLIHKIIFGIDFQGDKLVFHPFVPKALAGNRSLNNFKCRKAILNITMQGYGDVIKSFVIDGKPSSPSVSYELKGTHEVNIILANNEFQDLKINKVNNYTSPDVPIASCTGDSLSWPAVNGAINYTVIKNGQPVATTQKTRIKADPDNHDEYQVVATDSNQVSSFASEPVVLQGNQYKQTLEIEKFAGKASYPYSNYSGEGFVEISKEKNTNIPIQVNIENTGIYTISFRYANGNGPINTQNKCAIRTLKVDNKFAGTIILPQRGSKEWSNWGFSNSIQVKLTRGKHILSISLEPSNENMNGKVNQAMLDLLRIDMLSGR